MAAPKSTGMSSSKHRKVSGDETSKMSISDMEQLATLLAKAVDFKDDRAMKLVDFIQQAAGLKEDAEIERSGAMSDASKRRHEDWTAVETFDVAGSALEMMQDYELVEAHIEEFEQNKAKMTTGSYPAIGQPGGTTALNFGGYDRGFPLARSVKDEEEWGHTLITLPAMKSQRLSYAEFAVLARVEAEKRQYARFLVAKFGDKAVQQLFDFGECKLQGFDLAAYLKRVCYAKCEMRTPPAFQRQMK